MGPNTKRTFGGSLSNQYVNKLYELILRYVKEFEIQNPKEELDITTFLDSAQKWHLPLKRVKQPLLVSSAEQALQKYLTELTPQEVGTPTISLIESDEEKPLEANSIATTPNSTVNNSLNQNMMKLWKTSSKPDQKEEGSGNPAKKAKKSSSSYQTAPTYILEDLGGMDAIIEEVLELVVMPIRHPEIYLHTGIDPPRGILLHGPPGCGKTMLANALAGELGVPFLPISAPSVVSGMSGESEKKIRDVFDEARNSAPCILFIDEIDAITPKRETAQRQMEHRMVAQLLTCLDDLSWDKTNHQPVIVLAATNRPDSIDPALRRAGRFDREIQLPIPDELSRERILKVMSSKLKLSGDLNLTQLAKLTPGYVGADLKALVTAAGMIAVKRIFSSLVHQTSTTPTLEDPTDDPAPLTIQRFLTVHSDPLSDEELESLAINLDDFLEAVKKVQPSSKREGFATVPGVSWSDIGALSTIRQELRMAIVEPIRHRDLFTQVGISASCGVLLWGPPGCGKTLLAKAVANEAHSNFISVKGPELLNKYVGESERSIRQVFDRARASSPCVVFFDEMDALCGRRDENQSEVSARVVNTLLTELDGLESRKQVFIIAATNRPDMIDPAILRPGRLDKLLYVELPTPDERADILKTLTKKTPLSDTVDLKSIAHDDRATGFSGADLASLVRESSVVALKSALYKGPSENQSDGELRAELAQEKKVLVSMDHFNTALNKVSPSVSKQDMKLFEGLKVKFGWKY